jgi:hypothetical protein
MRPNTRLKLLAPVANGFGGRPEIRCASIPFVKTSSLRRLKRDSLGSVSEQPTTQEPN